MFINTTVSTNNRRVSTTNNRASSAQFTTFSEFSITDTSDLETTRTSYINEVFNASGLPTAPSEATSTNVTGTLHVINTSNLTNLDSADRYTYTMQDSESTTWTHYVYHLKTSATSNGKAIMLSTGHQSTPAGGYETFASDALGYGYDVFHVAMPVTFDNVENGSTVTNTSTSGHDQMTGIPDANFNALELFFFEKIRCINQFNSSYSEWSFVGISGGGWTATHMGALDTRIKNTFIIRGMQPRIFKTGANQWGSTEPDFEQGGNVAHLNTRTSEKIWQFYADYPYMDITAMATYPNRVVDIYNASNDACCFTDDMTSWTTTLSTEMTKANGTLNYNYWNPAASTLHELSSEDRAAIWATLGES